MRGDRGEAQSSLNRQQKTSRERRSSSGERERESSICLLPDGRGIKGGRSQCKRERKRERETASSVTQSIPRAVVRERERESKVGVQNHS